MKLCMLYVSCARNSYQLYAISLNGKLCNIIAGQRTNSRATFVKSVQPNLGAENKKSRLRSSSVLMLQCTLDLYTTIHRSGSPIPLNWQTVSTKRAFLHRPPANHSHSLDQARARGMSGVTDVRNAPLSLRATEGGTPLSFVSIE